MTNGILLTQHNQEIAQWSPDPFSRERVGSGHETTESATVVGTSLAKKMVDESWEHETSHAQYRFYCGKFKN